MQPISLTFSVFKILARVQQQLEQPGLGVWEDHISRAARAPVGRTAFYMAVLTVCEHVISFDVGAHPFPRGRFRIGGTE